MTKEWLLQSGARHAWHSSHSRSPLHTFRTTPASWNSYNTNTVSTHLNKHCSEVANNLNNKQCTAVLWACAAVVLTLGIWQAAVHVGYTVYLCSSAFHNKWPLGTKGVSESSLSAGLSGRCRVKIPPRPHQPGLRSGDHCPQRLQNVGNYTHMLIKLRTEKWVGSHYNDALVTVGECYFKLASSQIGRASCRERV